MFLDPDAGGPLASPVTQFSFDAMNNLLSVTDPLNHATSYLYDNLYRNTRITDALTGQTNFTHDAAGILQTLTDPVNNTTTWTYDGLNRVIEEENELGFSRFYVYDVNSNLTKLTDRNGRVTEYVYDDLNRNTQELWKDSGGATIRTLSFTFDAASQLTAASDPAASYSYVYDDLGRVTEQTQNITGLTPSIVFAQAFDANSNRTSLAATIGGTADFKNSYTFDNLNRMTRVVQEDVSGGNVVADKRVDFAYNAAGQFTQIDRYQSTGTSNGVAQTFFAYDGMGRLSDLDHKQNTTTLAGYDYVYDAASRITSIDSTVEGLSTFTYDVTNQLTAADHTSQPDENYSFDANGNRTMTGHTVIANNRLSTDGTYDYEYDNEGNQTKRTKISNGSYEENTWDHRNRLTKVTFKTAAGAVTKTVDYAYDVFSGLVKRTVDPDGAGGAAAVDEFFANDGYEPVLQFDGTAASDLSNRNLFGPAVKQILAVEDVTSLTQAGNVLWGLADHLGTPRDVADLDESTGVTAVTNHRTYNSFGTQVSETNAAVDFIFGETGKILDEDTGANLHLFRWLRGGQWLSQDPIGFRGGDTNLSRVVHNNPVNLIDPDGLSPLDDAFIPDGGGGGVLGYPDGWIPFQESADFTRYPDMGDHELTGEAWIRYNADGSVSIKGELWVTDERGCKWLATPNAAELALWNWARTKDPKYMNDPILKHNKHYLNWIARGLNDPRGATQAAGRIATPFIVNDPRNPGRNAPGGGVSGKPTRGSGAPRPPGSMIAEPTPLAPSPTVSVYHKGELANGRVAGDRALSTGTDRGCVARLQRAGAVHEFRIPRDVLKRWELDGKVRRIKDFDQATGTYNDELRFDPSLSDELNKYKVF